jgi:hypothetical protein
MVTRMRNTIILTVGLALLAAPSAVASAPKSIFADAAAGKLQYAPLTLTGHIATTPTGHVLSLAGKRKDRASPFTARVSDNFNCTPTGYWWSAWNGLYVTAEDGGYSGGEAGMLRARSNEVGAWQIFQLCQSYETHKWSFWNNAAERWVSVETGDPGGLYAMLRASGTGVGPSERFTLHEPSSEPTAVNAGANGLWVTAEFGYSSTYYGMMRARSAEVAAWQWFDQLWPG